MCALVQLWAERGICSISLQRGHINLWVHYIMKVMLLCMYVLHSCADQYCWWACMSAFLRVYMYTPSWDIQLWWVILTQLAESKRRRKGSHVAYVHLFHFTHREVHSKVSIQWGGQRRHGSQTKFEYLLFVKAPFWLITKCWAANSISLYSFEENVIHLCKKKSHYTYIMGIRIIAYCIVI